MFGTNKSHARNCFDDLMESLHVSFPSKATRDKDFNKTKDVFWDLLHPQFVLITSDAVKEVKKEIIFKHSWFPSPRDIQNVLNKFTKKEKKQNTKPKKQLSEELLMMDELIDSHRAKIGLAKCLQAWCKCENALQITEIIEPILDYFTESDWNNIKQIVFNQKENMSTNILVDIIIGYRKREVAPRWAEIDQAGLTGLPWQQKPSKEKLAMYKRLMTSLYNKTIPMMRFNNEKNYQEENNTPENYTAKHARAS